MKERRRYDFIFVGGGVAGLSLAYHLLRSPLRDGSILIVDPEAKDRNDRTLCFWTNQPTLFDNIVYRSWDQLQFVAEGLNSPIELHDYRYQMIRGIDFYQSVRQALAASGRAEFLPGTVEQIDDDATYATVSVDGQTYAGKWVFDSRFRLSQFKPKPTRYHFLRQHFKGWEIETPDQVFQPHTATFLDFRTPQQQEMRFFYMLPFSDRQALVEYVLLSREDDDQALQAYLETVLGIKAYRIVAEEGGINPLTDRPFPRRVGQHIMTIGTRGGRVKPSSGYAFMRIQHDSAAIVRSLLKAGHPFNVPPDPPLYRLCDSLMLQVMHRHGEQIKPIFTAMFRHNPIARIFRFLDETTSPWENLGLIISLPPWLFLQAWFHLKVLGRV